MGRNKENRFKFVSFVDRISSINVTLIRQQRDASAIPEQQETFFAEALEKFNLEEPSPHYVSFKKCLNREELRTYVQLLHRQEQVVKAVEEYLVVENSSCLPALFELTVCLCRDLQSDFYPHFWNIFECFLTIMENNSQNPELLEQAFASLAFLFKFLWRKMLKEPKKTFRRFVPLFSHKKHYFRRFAAEAFAFLMRKCQRPSKWIAFQLSILSSANQADLSEGVSQLLFQALKGVKNQFHSNAPNLLQNILTVALQAPEDQRDAADQLLVNLTPKLVIHTRAEYARAVSDVYLNCLSGQKSDADVKLLLELFKIWIQIKGGSVFPDYQKLLDILAEILDKIPLSPETTSSLLDLVSEIFHCRHAKMLDLKTEIRRFGETCLEKSGKDENFLDLLSKFLENCLDFNEIDPVLMDLMGKLADLTPENSEKRLLDLYCKFTVKRRPFLFGKELDAFEIVNLFDGENHSRVKNIICETLMDCALEIEVSGDLIERLTSILVLIPWFEKNLEIEAYEEEELLDSLVCDLLSRPETSSEYSALAWLCMYSLGLFNSDQLGEIPIDSILEFVRTRPTDYFALRLADVYFWKIDRNLLNNEVLLDTVAVLGEALMSPESGKRIVALNILCAFPVELPTNDAGETEKYSLFDICLSAEETPLTIESYRGRLVEFRKLNRDTLSKHIPAGLENQLELVPLRILLAQFYGHFSLIWNPVAELIESYARGCDSVTFWEFWNNVLAKAQSDSHGFLFSPTQVSTDDQGAFSAIFNFDELESQKTDYANFRLLLLKAMAPFSDLCEAKTRMLSPLLLKIAREEYASVDLMAATEENLLEKKERAENTLQDRKGTEKMVRRALLAFLTIYSKFKDPKSVYLEPEIMGLYWQLLQSPDCELQKTTLACIMKYKHKFLLPYRENLERLVDDRTFSDELVMFNIDEQVSSVTDEHRELLIPYLMSILYGKLQGRASGPGNNASMARRTAIFRFLAGCKSDEVGKFLDLIFGPVLRLIQDKHAPIESTVTEIQSSFSLCRSIPLQKLRILLANLSQVMGKLAPILDDYLALLFKICLVVGGLVGKMVQGRDRVEQRCQRSVKGLRQAVTERFSQFFASFENYEYSEPELRVFFHIWVWPQMEKQEENVNANLGLVKLFASWAKIPRYFCLLNVPSPENFRAIDALLDALNTASCTKSVQESVMSAVEHLLALADHEGEILPVKQLELQSYDQPINFGTKLILSHLDALLKFLEKSLAESTRHLKARDLMILEKISEFVQDSDTCTSLIGLILPFLERNCVKSEELQTNALKSIAHLTKSCEKPADFLRRLSVLFSLLSFRKSRDALCFILGSISIVVAEAEVKTGLSLMQQLNSWDRKRIEEPDYILRQDSFATVFEAFRAETKPEFLSEDFLLLFAHNCIHFLQSEDLSIRDSARHGVQLLSEFLSKSSFSAEFLNLFLEQHMLKLVRSGLKSKNESLRHDYISILSSLVQWFPSHPKLASLQPLRNEAEPDLDFFTNISYIQQHRRLRAIWRLCEALQPTKDTAATLVIPVELIHAYIMPMISPFVTEAVYAKNTGLVDEGVRFIGIVAGLMPWKRYQSLLQYYLFKLSTELERQKVMVRVVSTLLDSFHFDLVSHTGEAMDVDAPKHSTKIYDAVVNEILPKLRTSLDAKGVAEQMHKRAGASRHYDEDAEILRAPVALAMVKLLQKLPRDQLELNLPGILLKVCQLLKSRSKDVREATRKILMSITECLGARYLPFLLKEMRIVLTRGYQLHVLIYTIHVLLCGLSTSLSSGDLDPCLSDILEVCNEEMFGEVAEEKEVEEITRNLMEAKSGNKVYDTYHIVGKFITVGCLSAVLSPLKDVLDTKQNSKVLRKVSEALKYFAFGLAANQQISTSNLMVFVHQLLTENIDFLFVSRKRPLEEFEEEETPQSVHPLRPQSTYILPPNPGRRGVLPKTAKHSSSHVLVEFSLQLLHSVIKAGSLKPDNTEHLGLLDPFVPLVTRCLETKYDKVLSLSLRALIWFVQFDLPKLKADIGKTVEQLFLLLSQYAGLGAASAKGNAFELNQTLFKAITSVIRDVQHHSLTNKQTQILFHYVEQDMFDSQKQATAFSLLKAILVRGVPCEGIRSVMNKVQKLSITAPAQHVKVQCRQVMLQFLTVYPLGRHPRKHLEFYLTQLSYEYEEGRISAIEMLNAIFEHLDLEKVHEFSVLCFVHLSERLINDNSPKCKQLIALAMRNLLNRIELKQRDALFQIVLDWLQDEKAAHRRLSAEVLVQFVEAEGEKFKKRLETLMPIYVSVLKNASEHQSDLTTVLLNTLCRLMKENPTWCRAIDNRSLANDIWGFVSTALKSQEVSVRLSSSQLLGQLLSSYVPAEFKEGADEYAFDNLHILCQNCCWLLRHSETGDAMADQVVKNLVFIAKALVHQSKPTDEAESVTFTWLCDQLARVCRFEMVRRQSSLVKRSAIFKWLGAVALDAEQETLDTLLKYFLSHLHREMKRNNRENPLAMLSTEVSELLKSRVGVEQFSKLTALCERESAEKKENRRQQRAVEAVTDPAKAIRRKTKKHENKVLAKKRKILEAKPYRKKGKVAA